MRLSISASETMPPSPVYLLTSASAFITRLGTMSSKVNGRSINLLVSKIGGSIMRYFDSVFSLLAKLALSDNNYVQ